MRIAKPILAVTTPLVRDGTRLPGGKLPTYSLARTQMAFWFVNVVLAVLIIWAVTGSVPPITSSARDVSDCRSGAVIGGGTPPEVAPCGRAHRLLLGWSSAVILSVQRSRSEAARWC